MTLTTQPQTSQPWDNWEDYAAGLYGRSFRPGAILDSVRLLSSADEFAETAREMIRAWPGAAAHNLRLLRTGCRAWVGQSSCCYHHGATAIETAAAWGRLSNVTQDRANKIAASAAAEYMMGGLRAETLFDG